MRRPALLVEMQAHPCDGARAFSLDAKNDDSS